VALVVGRTNLDNLLDASEKGSLVLDVLVPLLRRDVGRDDDDLGGPVNKATLDGHGHLVTVKNAQQLGVLDVTVKVVDKDHLVAVVTIEPIA